MEHVSLNLPDVLILIKPAELSQIIQLLSASGHVSVSLWVVTCVCAADEIYVQQAFGLNLI